MPTILHEGVNMVANRAISWWVASSEAVFGAPSRQPCRPKLPRPRGCAQGGIAARRLPAFVGRISDGPTALRLEALPVRAVAAGARKGRERSCLAASRPDLIVPDPVGPLRGGESQLGAALGAGAEASQMGDRVSSLWAAVSRPRPIWAILEFGNPTDR